MKLPDTMYNLTDEELLSMYGDLIGVTDRADPSEMREVLVSLKDQLHKEGYLQGSFEVDDDEDT